MHDSHRFNCIWKSKHKQARSIRLEVQNIDSGQTVSSNNISKCIGYAIGYAVNPHSAGEIGILQRGGRTLSASLRILISLCWDKDKASRPSKREAGEVFNRLKETLQ